MDENEQQKRKRGRPYGSKNKPRPNATQILEPDELEMTPDRSLGRPAAPVNLERVYAPKTMLMKPEEPGAVPEMIRTALAIRQTVDLNDVRTLWSAMEQYINLCATTGMKITNATLYMACGVGRTDIHNWEYGLRRQNNPEYREFAIMCREICAAAREQYGIEGKVNPILTIFHQKAYDGFTDTPQQEAVKDPLGEITDPQKLAEKYKDLITD